MDEKQYYNAYKNASKEGTLPNAFVRIILAGPFNVGKTSIRRVFTKLGLTQDSSATEICEVDEKLFGITTYELIGRKICDLKRVQNRLIVTEIEKSLQDRLPLSNLLNDQHLDQSINKSVVPTNSISMTENDSATPSKAYAENRSIIGNDDLFEVVNTESATSARKGIFTDHTPMQEADSNAIPTNSKITDTKEQFYDQSASNSVTNEPESQFSKNISQICQQIRSKLTNIEPLKEQRFGKLFDFGGQPIYNVIHRPFMSTNSISILVFNISQNIDEKVITREGDSNNMTYFEVMREWLTSIIGIYGRLEKITADINGKKSPYSLPIVILVASHADTCDDEKQCLSKYNEFAETLLSRLPMYQNNICRSQIIFNCKHNDNSDTTEKHRRQCCQDLHTIINGFAKSLPFMVNEIPLRWYIITTVLQFAVSDEAVEDADFIQINKIRGMVINKTMKLNDIRKVIKDCELYKDEEDLVKMLSYLHDIGEVIFCQVANGDAIIIIDVDWFLKLMRQIIRISDPKTENAAITSGFKKLEKTGIMSQDYLQYILMNNKLSEHNDIIIKELLKNYDIICEIKSKKEQKMEYFVPYLLKPEVCKFEEAKYNMSSKLYIGYDHDKIPYIPDGIFYCLLVSCLKEWNNTKVKIYHRCVKYFIKGFNYYIIVKKEKFHISLQYCYTKCKNSNLERERYNKIEESIYNSKPHELIKSKLSTIIKERMPKFNEAICQFHVKCMECTEIISIEKENLYPDNNTVSCFRCDEVSTCQPTQDWMFYNKNSLHGMSNIK